MVWPLGMTTVFVPVDERIMHLVFKRADLIVEPEMPPGLLAVCAHVAGYRAIPRNGKPANSHSAGKTISRSPTSLVRS